MTPSVSAMYDGDDDYVTEEDLTKRGWEYVGMVGVDSGQLMIVDPCYVDAGTPENRREGFSYDRWLTQLFNDHDVNSTHKALGVEWDILPGGAVIAPTAYGDGGYPVFVRKNREGFIVAMQVFTGDAGD